MQAYSNKTNKNDPYALPDLEIFELTAREVAESQDDLIFEYMKRHKFRLATMRSRDRDKMFDAMVEEKGIQGGWFYWYCFPGCLPDSDPIGPYDSAEDARQAAEDPQQ
jgi:hypothetical protein